jgi:hypothetical protein
MKNMAKIKIRFYNLTDAALLVKASYIVTSMTNNPHFVNPVPPLANVQTAIDAFDAALTSTKTSREATIIKRDCREALETVLTDLGLFVQLVSKGSEAILASSGYDLASKPVPVGVLPKPENFMVKPADSPGSVKLSMGAINGARSYVYEYTQAPVTEQSTWTPVNTPRASVVVDDLTSGGQYSFRAVAIGADPTRVYSDEITSYVL